MEANLIPTVTISEAKSIISSMAHCQSILLLSAPGVGKSDAVRQAAANAGLECKSLLGTQIAPEDVSGIPRIVGERSVFCPPRILLPEDENTPFCLFLDELPACSPDIQKAFYSLLLERRIGEHKLPEGTWVVAAGNRAEDKALVRSISTALINRVIILQVTVDIHEWVAWANNNGIRKEIIDFLLNNPASLRRSVPESPVPFSTPRAWAQLSNALTLMEKAGTLNEKMREVLAYGTVSAEDAAVFCVYVKMQEKNLPSLAEIIRNPTLLPSGKETDDRAWRCCILQGIRRIVETDNYQKQVGNCTPEQLNLFLMSLDAEERIMLLMGCVAKWGNLGADQTILDEFSNLVGNLL
ncbi:MAG: hypothetical protein IKR81_08105 [Victivallales bacterium]|nr:hypothetical protein [Victivallales bacterium]